MIEQKCHEWGIKMWTATIDFTKAVDSITHKSIWKALKSSDIKHEYISFLKKIFRDQKAPVRTDEEGNIFEIRKGTKQGDPAVNTFLQNLLKDDIQRWQKKQRNGYILEPQRPRLPHEPEVCRRRASVRNLRRTASKNVVRFQESAEKVGLRIHPEKTKILSNKSSINSDTKKEMQVDDIKIEILKRGESVRYLGQMNTFRQQRRPKSRIESGQPGRRFTSTGRS